ncbi:hypothetical protein IAU59_005901 [Kwoniella sp. CBS 9459]
MDLALPSIASQLFTPPLPRAGTYGVSNTTQGDNFSSKGRLEERPVTPLDFFGFTKSTTAKATMPPPDRRGLLSDPHHSVRTSVDLGRPPVDPSIKGVAQGWDDDPTIPLALQSRPSSTAHQTLPNPRSTPHPLNQSTTSQRLGPFRETRTKLSSFGKGLREKDKDRDPPKPGTGLKLHKGSVRLTHRSSSMNPGLITKRRPTSPSAHGTHNPTLSVYSESSFNTHGTGDTSNSIPVVPPSAQTASTDASTDFSHLFTPSPTSVPQHDPDYPASVGSNQSVSSRDRVMGIKKDPTPVPPAGMKTFIKPDVADVLPFAAGHPFAAWSAPDAEDVKPAATSTVGDSVGVGRPRRNSVPLLGSMQTETRDEQIKSQISLEGWKEAPRTRTGLPGKKVWVDAKGEEITTAYRVGWERDVIDLEARLHETMYDIAGERHTFVEVSEPPQAVLDLGTGAGFWPISMALQWPQTTFIGMDLVPCQVDLSLLASAERTARSTSDGKAKGFGLWESVEQRITWQRGNFLNELPFDTGVFDLVHLRFVNLGVPETKWFDLLEEATRVLKRGGKLEIVETSYRLPGTAPVSLKNSFASVILADMVHPLPLLPLQFTLPSIDSLKGNSGRPSFEKTFTREPPGALHDAVTVWVKSALEYKGTSLVKTAKGGKKGLQGIGERVKKELMWADAKRWAFDEGDVSQRRGNKVDVPNQEKEKGLLDPIICKEDEVGVWVWVLTKK